MRSGTSTSSKWLRYPFAAAWKASSVRPCLISASVWSMLTRTFWISAMASSRLEPADAGAAGSAVISANAPARPATRTRSLRITDGPSEGDDHGCLARYSAKIPDSVAAVAVAVAASPSSICRCSGVS